VWKNFWIELRAFKTQLSKSEAPILQFLKLSTVETNKQTDR
jgi:hypothetical protein